ncbi:Sodium/hydrogen exchanger 2 [Forsythia ovata]|uniref:Sodium/hydrogen exchanger 2 n=1 Tax=Forsythia ovata TaxID=205694 RepID=A0ABD1VEB9_9LAMI
MDTDKLIRLGGIVSNSENAFIDSLTLFVALLCACIVIGRLLEENRWLNEWIIALVIGLCTGFIILLTSKGKSSRIMEFDKELFVIYLLPPIIFNAGFKVKKKQFFKNFMTIMLFGAVGTLISFCIISLGAKGLFETIGIGDFELQDYLAIGAILSATDSVCTLQKMGSKESRKSKRKPVLNQDERPLLYSLVFGEGVVNDASSVVLFDISNINSRIALQFVGNFLYLFVTSTLLGVSMGLLSAYIIKKLYAGRHSTDCEVALMILMAYLSYIMAERFDLSGILTVFFCGIVMSHYTWHNVTEKSRVTVKHTLATLSLVSEIFIFLYVGMDALDVEKWKLVGHSPGKSVGASAGLLGLVLVGRASFVFPLSLLSNWTMKSERDQINFKQQVTFRRINKFSVLGMFLLLMAVSVTIQVTIWWSGLMRGAVSMALVYNQVFGLFTKPLLKFLLPQPEHPSSSMIPSKPSSPRYFILPLLIDEQDS